MSPFRSAHEERPRPRKHDLRDVWLGKAPPGRVEPVELSRKTRYEPGGSDLILLLALVIWLAQFAWVAALFYDIIDRFGWR